MSKSDPAEKLNQRDNGSVIEGDSMFNAITIAREYGSGGADIGRKVAEILDWECLDKQIIERAAIAGAMDRNFASAADECSYSWWGRVLKGFQQGGPSMALGASPQHEVDFDALQRATAGVVQEAAKVGKCVIIGRSAQCILRQAPTVFHVLVYAPQAEKLARMKIRHPQEHDLPALLRRMDAERTHYTQAYYGCDWSNRHLYHMCINSKLGVDACADLIVKSLHLSGVPQAQPA
jgi:hypothetical protein